MSEMVSKEMFQAMAKAFRAFAKTLEEFAPTSFDATTFPFEHIQPMQALTKKAKRRAKSSDGGRRCPQSNWARVGGHGELPDTASILSSAAYRDSFRSSLAREIYIGACPGLIRLSSIFHFPIYHIGTVSRKRINERIGEMSVDGYGSNYLGDDGYVRDLEGFDDWSSSHMYNLKEPSPNSPVTIGPRALGVRLPTTMTANMFDKAFDREIRKGALDAFVLTPAGALHCEALNIDPALAQRVTPYPLERRLATVTVWRSRCSGSAKIAIGWLRSPNL